jgi:hypothetical protein
LTAGLIGTCWTSGPTGLMQKGPVGTRQMEKGPSRDFYDELQASWMSNRDVPQVHVGWRKDRAETFMTNYKRHG